VLLGQASTTPCENQPPTGLHDLFLASRHAFAGRPALWADGCTLTYSELSDAAARLASVIHAARGNNFVASQLQCGLLVNRTPSAYASVLASLMAGSAYVPLNPRFPSARLREILAASAIDTVIVDHRSVAAAGPLLESSQRRLTVLLPDTAAANELAPRSAGHQLITRSEIESTAPVVPAAGTTPEDGAYLLFTSGSTGQPKGVLVSNNNALAYIANVRGRYHPGPDDRFSQLFDFSFDVSVHDMFLAWSVGGCLCCAPEDSLAGLGGYIRKCGLTFWFSVPSTAAFMRQLHMLDPGSYPQLRWSLFAGEALPPGLARAWQRAAPNSAVENLYGPTEATIAVTAYRLPSEDVTEPGRPQTMPIGLPLPGQRVMVVDERGWPVADGSAGELYLGGSQVAQGYWRAPEATADRFRPPECIAAKAQGRWYRTGDRAVMSKDHGLVFLGRIDRQCKINGHRVELLEVENAVRAAAGTDMVAAFAWPIGEGGLTSGIACFVSRAAKSEAEIIGHCRELLPSYMVPGQLLDLANWPLNTSGKTDYTSLAVLLEKAHAQAGQ
jgi:D-alanine--poly(phosphoribitol) ligase subunit 1